MSNNNNFKPNLEGYKPLRPFNLFMKNNFPFIENTFEALDTYGLICQLVKYLNTVIENEQTTEHNVSLLSNAFNELNDYVSHYFDNLDVQEEINNKLDDMVEAGTLQEIIGDYLNATAIWGFDNVESMKDSTNLINGSFARTLGYYEKNDGGGALYKITNTESESQHQEELDSGLYATLINENFINVKQLGAYGDGIHDDTNIIKDSILLTAENNTLYFPEGNYLITDTLNVNKNINIKCDGILISNNCRPLFLFDQCINTNVNIYKIQEIEQQTLNIIENTNNNAPIVLKNTQYVNINIKEVKDFNIGILLVSNNEATWGGCYYNTISIENINGCFHGIMLLSLINGSTNANKFNNITYQYHTWETDLIPYFITIKNTSGNNYYNNANMFYRLMAEYGVDVEGGPRLLNLVNGQNNYFEFDRSEIYSTSNATPFVFESGARCNRVMTNFILSNFNFKPDSRNNYVYCPIQYINRNHTNNIENITSSITTHENITINSGIVFNDYINKVVYMHLVLQTTGVITATQTILSGVPTPIEHIQHYCPWVASDSLYATATDLVPIYISRADNTVVNRTYLGANQTFEIDLVYKTSLN